MWQSSVWRFNFETLESQAISSYNHWFAYIRQKWLTRIPLYLLSRGIPACVLVWYSGPVIKLIADDQSISILAAVFVYSLTPVVLALVCCCSLHDLASNSDANKSMHTNSDCKVKRAWFSSSLSCHNPTFGRLHNNNHDKLVDGWNCLYTKQSLDRQHHQRMTVL